MSTDNNALILNKFWEVALSSNKLNNAGYWNFIFDIYLKRSKNSASIVNSLRNLILPKINTKFLLNLLQVSGLLTWIVYLFIDKIFFKLIERGIKIERREAYLTKKVNSLEKKKEVHIEFEKDDRLIQRIKGLNETLKQVEYKRRERIIDLREDLRDTKIQFIGQGYQNDQYKMNNKSDAEQIKSTLRSIKGVLITKSLRERAYRTTIH